MARSEEYGLNADNKEIAQKTAGEVKVSIKDVRRVFNSSRGEVIALNGFNFDIYENEFICIVGPSGCGKSTILNILAGLDKQTSGEILVDGKEIKGPSPERGVVFQQYALFPWMSVKQNIEFGLKLQKRPKDEVSRISDHYIDLVGLTEFKNAYPKELSGGMKQRVAIARTYATNPSLMLMDEPFGALDAQTRAQLQTDLITAWEQERKTCIFITHDVDEAVLLAQKVIVMSARPGRIKTVINIDLPYPRTQKTKLSPKFHELKDAIWEQVYNEYLAQRK